MEIALLAVALGMAATLFTIGRIETRQPVRIRVTDGRRRSGRR